VQEVKKTPYIRGLLELEYKKYNNKVVPLWGTQSFASKSLLEMYLAH
jgi:hypothetical protein